MAVSTSNCHWVKTSLARSKLGVEFALAASALRSEGTGESKSGRAEKSSARDLSSRPRSSSAKDGLDITCQQYPLATWLCDA